MHNTNVFFAEKCLFYSRPASILLHQIGSVGYPLFRLFYTFSINIVVSEKNVVELPVSFENMTTLREGLMEQWPGSGGTWLLCGVS